MKISVPAKWRYENGEDNTSYYFPPEGAVDGEVHSIMMIKSSFIQEMDGFSNSDIEIVFDEVLNGLVQSGFQYKDSIKNFEINGIQSRKILGTQEINGAEYDIIYYLFQNKDYLVVVCFAQNQSHIFKYDHALERIILSITDNASVNNEIQTEANTEKKDNSISATQENQEKPTEGQKNALSRAESYLKFTAFSYNGLIEQLEYSQFTHEEAVYAVDHCGADWNEQAEKKAKAYLDRTAFSRNELIEQIEYNGFTYEQAVYGAEANGY